MKKSVMAVILTFTMALNGYNVFAQDSKEKECCSNSEVSQHKNMNTRGLSCECGGSYYDTGIRGYGPWKLRGTTVCTHRSSQRYYATDSIIARDISSKQKCNGGCGRILWIKIGEERRIECWMN